MLSHYALLGGLLATTMAAPTSADCPDNTTMANSWDDVSVSTDLKYQPCFQNYTCAYLEVPLDYDNSSAGTAAIAFLKYSSPNQPALGDLLFNSGGPGESPIQYLMTHQTILSTLLGDSYNIVAMDPRGVNNSEPNTDCFMGSSGTVPDVWQMQLFDVEPRSPDSIRKYYQASGAFGTWCTQILNDTTRYVNTPATAQDMLQYFEKLAESEGKDPSSELVNYYGISYGTALGTTFANLYPDRVGRFIIDGVVDGEDYYFGNWSQNILQADAAVEAFFDLCAKAGPACALYGNSSITAAQIKDRVDGIIGTLMENPLPVADAQFATFPTVFTHLDLLLQVLDSVNEAAVAFGPLATLLTQIEQGNASYLISQLGIGIFPASSDPVPSPSAGEVPKLVIACNDNNHHYKGTEQDLFDLFKFNEGVSHYVGDIWTAVIVPQCRNLNFTPPENQLFQGYKKVTTKTPILFTDNTLDAVASSYYKMSAFFEGSVVLLEDAIAHGLVNSGSKCVNNYLDTYLRTLQMPPANTTCAADVQPFSVPSS